MTIVSMIRAIAARQGLHIGFVTDERRTNTPHTVEQFGLTVHQMGRRFALARYVRLGWCSKHCRAAWEIEPIRSECGEDVGRRFRFADKNDAERFAKRFRLSTK
ncbi:hypothetical protein [Azospirillum sp.]|uniref:hypothetical protein n=1 Tax=Azospirillum sp. TaxID=34012 RepID=UPI002615B44C|nr:hypothetical protein [Azospirillum sp.]